MRKTFGETNNPFRFEDNMYDMLVVKCEGVTCDIYQDWPKKKQGMY